MKRYRPSHIGQDWRMIKRQKKRGWDHKYLGHFRLYFTEFGDPLQWECSPAGYMTALWESRVAK